MTRRREVWYALYQEFQQVRRDGTWRNDTPGNVSSICQAVAEWVETGNPFYMDYALEIALYLDAPLTPTFTAELRSAIYARSDGTANGTSKQVRRAYMKDRAFQIVCNLRYHGTPIEEASEKASVWLDKFSSGEFCMKASSLEKQYQSEFVKSGLEKMFHTGWNELGLPEGAGAQEWTATRTSMPGIGGTGWRNGRRR